MSTGAAIIAALGVLVGVALTALNVVEISWVGSSTIGVFHVVNAVVLFMQRWANKRLIVGNRLNADKNTLGLCIKTRKKYFK